MGRGNSAGPRRRRDVRPWRGVHTTVKADESGDAGRRTGNRGRIVGRLIGIQARVQGEAFDALQIAHPALPTARTVA